MVPSGTYTMPPPGEYEVRSLRRADYARYRPLVGLAVGSFERSTGLDMVADASIDQLSRRWVWFLLGLLRWFGRPLMDVLVAVDAGEVVGTGSILWLPRTAYVAGIVTKPEVRGRGVASRILSAQADFARRRHRDWLALDVESENATALRLYRAAGYRETGRFSWFTRTDVPPIESPPSSLAPPVGVSEWPSVIARLDASRPAEYRAAFPAGPRLLHHNEIMVRGPAMQHGTWRRELDGGGVALVRAYYVSATGMRVYFPITTAPEPSADALVGPIDAASEWLRPFAPTRILAVAPEPRAGIAAVLERKGFAAASSTVAMIRRSSA